jgi:hypothetical protein
MYSDQIDEHEKQLGFVLDRVPNAAGMYHGREEYVYAAVYNLDSENIIVKERCPTGGFRYCHRKKEKSVWKIVDNTHTDPHNAVRQARETLTESTGQA